MCTVSIVPNDGGFRLVSNRDEQLTRPDALPPRLHRAGRRRATFPIDPVGGGTWVGVNDAGIAVTLLSRQRPCGVPRGMDQVSRGVIVRTLLAASGLDAILGALRALDIRRFEPFRLVAVRGANLVTATSDSRTLRLESSVLDAPTMFTSSSLGDALVEPPRRRLFERMVTQGAHSPLEAQARFHRHHWAARPHVSVCMTRADARTVSRTVVDVTGEGVALAYEPLAPPQPG